MSAGVFESLHHNQKLLVLLIVPPVVAGSPIEGSIVANGRHHNDIVGS